MRTPDKLSRSGDCNYCFKTVRDWFGVLAPMTYALDLECDPILFGFLKSTTIFRCSSFESPRAGDPTNLSLRTVFVVWTPLCTSSKALLYCYCRCMRSVDETFDILRIENWDFFWCSCLGRKPESFIESMLECWCKGGLLKLGPRTASNDELDWALPRFPCVPNGYS